MAENGAVFQEVIGVEFDSQQFAQSLDQLISVYEQKMQEMSGKGIEAKDIINLSGVAELQTQIADIASTVKALGDAFVESFTSLGSATQQAAESQTAIKQAIQETDDVAVKHSSKMEELAAKDFAFQSEQFDKAALKQYETVEKAERDYELAQIAKVNAAEAASAKLEELAAKDAAFQSEQLDKVAAKQYALVEKAERDYELAQIKKADIAAKAKAQQDSGFFGGLGQGFTGGEELSGFNIGAMIGQVAKFQLLWTGIGIAMTAAMAPLRAIIDGFKEGFQYLNDLEQKSYELTGVLDANVRFSNDLKQNFQDASQAAPQVVKALQDVAAATGLKPDNLFRAFSALTESGGTGAVNNLQELVQLTELFNLAMRAAGASVETSRLLISQMPNAMSGNISATSKWLEVLHMGPQEWNKMVKAGLEHHDLLQRLQTAMQPYLDATAQAALNEEELSTKVDNLKKRLEATFVAPYQEAYKKFLTDVIDLMGDMDAKAASINKRMAEATNANMSSKHPWMMLAMAALTVDEPTGGTAFPSETNAFAQGPQFDAALSAYAEDLMKRHVSAKNQPQGKANNDALKALQDDFTKQLQKNKDDYKTALSDIDEAEKEHTISVEAATDKRIQAVLKEKQANDDLVKSIRSRLQTVGGTVGARRSFTNKLDGAQESSDTSARTSVDKDYSQYTQNELQVEETALRAEMQLDRQKHDAAIQLAKDEGATHLEVVNMEIAADRDYFSKWQAQINIQKELAGQNEKALQDVKDAQSSLNQQRSDKDQQREQETYKSAIADQTNIIEQETFAANKALQSAEAKVAADKKGGASANDLNKERKALLDSYLSEVSQIQKDILATLAQADAMGVQGEAVDKLRKDYEALDASKAKAVGKNTSDQHYQLFTSNALGDSTPSVGSDINDFAAQIQDWKKGNHDFGDATNILVTGFKAFSASVTTFAEAYREGSKQGGILGGAGAVASSAGGLLGGLGNIGNGKGGILDSIAGFAGPAGAIMSVAGGVMSMIGGMFTAAAQHIADTIKKEFDKTISNLQNGTIGLNQAIQQVEQERNDAISQLSNKKGGKDQLNQLLPQLDSQLASLKQQQADVLTTFEQQLAQLQTGSTVLGGVLKTWTDINKQIKDYIAAGGDAVKAQQLLNLTLQQMQKDAQTAFDQGNQTAIQDALNLNNLLTQRINLQKQFAATMFGLQTQDSLERRGSNAIIVGTQTQQQLKDFQTQMADLDNQISLGQQKVALEGQVFDINKSVADLQASSNALTIKALQDQLAILKDQAKIVAGIYTAGGNTAFTAAFAAGISAGGSNVPVTININGTGGVDPADVADQMSAELARRGRYGLGTRLDTQYA